MTVEEVQQQVALIEQKKDDDDDDVAHRLEDKLHQHVLRAIAAGAPNPAELAAEALKTLAIDFSRWYA